MFSAILNGEEVKIKDFEKDAMQITKIINASRTKKLSCPNPNCKEEIIYVHHSPNSSKVSFFKHKHFNPECPYSITNETTITFSNQTTQYQKKKLFVFGKKSIAKNPDGSAYIKYNCFFKYNNSEVQLIPCSESQIQLFDILFKEGPYELNKKQEQFSEKGTGNIITYDAYSITIDDVSFALKVKEKSAKELFAYLIRKTLE